MPVLSKPDCIGISIGSVRPVYAQKAPAPVMERSLDGREHISAVGNRASCELSADCSAASTTTSKPRLLCRRACLMVDRFLQI
jgi:hypothetical protein